MTDTLEEQGLIQIDPASLASTWDGVSEQSLVRALHRPVVCCLESGLEDPLNSVGRRTGLLLVASTRSAFRINVAKAFIDSLDDRLSLSPDLQLRIRTVAHEIVMNAVIHGNLGLDSSLRENFSDMAKLQELIEYSIADPDVSRRIVRLEACWVSRKIYLLVSDSGRGFDPSKRSGCEAQGSGRGLGIVEALSDSVEFLRGGTAIRTGFER